MYRSDPIAPQLSPTGRGLCHLGEHGVDGLGGKPHRPTAPPRVLQASHPKLHEPTPPLAHRLFRNLERVCDPLIRLASRGEEDDPTTSHRRSRRGARPHRTAELVGVLWGQGNRRRNSRHPRRIASGTDNVNHLAVSTLARAKHERNPTRNSARGMIAPMRALPKDKEKHPRTNLLPIFNRL